MGVPPFNHHHITRDFSKVAPRPQQGVQDWFSSTSILRAYGKSSKLLIYHLVMTNVAMENGPFIDDFPIKTSIFNGFSMAMLNNQMVKGYLMGCCGIWDLVGDFTRLRNGIQLELMGFFLDFMG
jgi:hypothetical protein